MSIAIPELVITGLMYVILTYITFRLIRHKKEKGGNDDGGQELELSAPKIDLPPGVDWPNDKLIDTPVIEEGMMA